MLRLVAGRAVPGYNRPVEAKIVFMGSPDFAIPTLEALIEQCTVSGVVTQPDRPAGRGRKLSPPPVKALAEQAGIPVIQPRRLREPWAYEQLRLWAPDLIVVAAYGQILRQNVLDLPPFGALNVHASLLPRWRGAAPIQAAILHGDTRTGITIMKMDAGLDTGPVLSQRSIAIDAQATAGSLAQELADLGARLLIETMPRYLAAEIELRPQDDDQATYAPMLKKKDGLLDFAHSSERLARQVRAYHPWPGAFLHWKEAPLKVLRAASYPDAEADAAPGSTLRFRKMPAVAAAGGILVLETVQPPGKNPMPGRVFLNGARDWGREP